MGFNAALQRQNTRDLEKAKAVEEPKPATEFKSRAPSFRRELLRRNSREPESDARAGRGRPREQTRPDEPPAARGKTASRPVWPRSTRGLPP